MTPLIGLTTYREDAPWGVWDQRADLLPAQYAEAVVACGGVPVLLPPIDGAGAADAVVARLDGLVICGGADVDPTRYGAEPHPRTVNWRPGPGRVGARAPGRGRGGRPAGPGRVPRHAGDGRARGRPARPAHARTWSVTTSTARAATCSAPCRCAPRPAAGSRRWSATSLTVNCHHHQSVAEHPGFVASAHAADGTLEAMEAAGDRFCVAVQWHPETAADVGLLAGLVRAAAAYRP